MNKPHTWDGKPLTAGVSGFNNYSTKRVEPSTTPASALSLADILNQINYLRKFCDQAKLERVFATLNEHISNTDNPHKTTLDQFTYEVADILYQEFLNQGGSGSLDSYLTALFNTLRVATLDEMQSSDNERLLISIRGAKNLIKAHEEDLNAHQELIDKWFPGEPMTVDPELYYNPSLSTSVSDLAFIDMGDEVSLVTYFKTHPHVYTVVNKSGMIETYDPRSGIPADYSQGVACVPCFGPRTNIIPNSINFNLQHLDNFIANSTDIKAPDGSTDATALTTVDDESAVEHNLVLEDFALDTGIPKSVSLFAKAGTCRYLCFRYFDMVASEIEVFAVFDLEKGVLLTGNHLNRYTARMDKLAGGWYRCCFNMYHPIGQIDDLKITFFNENKSDVTSSYKFKATAGIAAYVFGLQVELGFNASPYIPTYGEAVLRPAIRVKIPVESITLGTGTLGINAVNPKTHPTVSVRPLFDIVTEDSSDVLKGEFDTSDNLIVSRFNTITVDDTDISALNYQETIAISSSNWVQMAYTTTSTDTTLVVNGVSSTSTNTETYNNANPAYLYVGCDAANNYLDDYVKDVIFYNASATDGQLTFINGDIYE